MAEAEAKAEAEAEAKEAEAEAEAKVEAEAGAVELTRPGPHLLHKPFRPDGGGTHKVRR